MPALALLAAHALADFPLQTDRMAAEKFNDAEARFGHAWIHLWVTCIVLWATPGISAQTALPAAVAVAVLHYAIDSRRWADPKPDFEAYPLAVDQTLHLVSLWVVSVVIL